MNQTDEKLRVAAIDALQNATRRNAAEAAILDLGHAHYAGSIPDFGVWVRLVAEDLVANDYKGSLPDFHQVYENVSRRWQVSQKLPSDANRITPIEETNTPGPELKSSAPSGLRNGVAQLLEELNSYIADSIKATLRNWLAPGDGPDATFLNRVSDRSLAMVLLATRELAKPQSRSLLAESTTNWGCCAKASLSALTGPGSSRNMLVIPR